MSDCKTCLGGSRAIGSTARAVKSFVAAQVGGDVTDETYEHRRSICRKKCLLKDSSGSRLFRVLNRVSYCGRPRKIENRDESVDGCGCNLSDKGLIKGKWRAAASSCPNDFWDSVE